MIKKTKTAIILVNYNGFEDTEACIKTIADVNGELPFIVVVDNNSKDLASLETLHQFYNPLHIIMNDNNIGFGRANNVGIQWALKNIDFEYLLLLNNDTLIEPNTIEQLIIPFSKDSKIGITTGKIMYEGNRNLVWYGGGKINFLRGWPKIDDYNKSATKEGANKSKYVSFVSGCTMMFTKESIKRIKGFDEDFFMYCEDLELCLRAKKLGYKLYYESFCTIYHKVQGSLKKNNSQFYGDHPKNPNLSFLFYHMKTNQYQTFKKHLTGYELLKFKAVYWMEYFYKVLKYLFYQRFDMLVTFKKVLLRNLSKANK